MLPMRHAATAVGHARESNPHGCSVGRSRAGQGALKLYKGAGVRAGAAPAGPEETLFQKAGSQAPLPPPGAAPYIKSYTFDKLQQWPAFKDIKDITSITVTVNEQAPQPAPVVVMFNAFMTWAECYTPLHRQLAAASYAVVQYDVPLLNYLDTGSIKREVDIFPNLKDWIKEISSPAGSKPELRGKLDVSRLLVAGHSRGGKLAALNYTSKAGRDAGVAACYLIDPVDEMPTKGVDALEAAGSPKIGVTGFGRTGALNPERSNYLHFLAAAGVGSQLKELPKTMHLQLLDAGLLSDVCWLVDQVCLIPGAEQLSTALFDWISSQAPSKPAVTLQRLVSRPEFRELVRQLDRLAAVNNVQLRGPAGDALALLTTGDAASAMAAVQKLESMRRLSGAARRVVSVRQAGPEAARIGSIVRQADSDATRLSSIVAAAMVAWLQGALPPPGSKP